MTTPTLPVLYSFRRCPYAIRARMALRYAGVPVDIVEVALRQKPAELLAASPKGTVPVLVTPDGAVIDQSLDIMQWALRQSDPDGWLGAGSAGEADRWIALNDGVFKPLLDRYKYAARHPELTTAEHRSHALDAMICPMQAQPRRWQRRRNLLQCALSLPASASQILALRLRAKQRHRLPDRPSAQRICKLPIVNTPIVALALNDLTTTQQLPKDFCFGIV